METNHNNSHNHTDLLHLNKIQVMLKQQTQGNDLKEHKIKLFNNILSQLVTFNQMNPTPKLNNKKNVTIVGEKSSGKSSTLNWVLGTKEKVGVYNTTPHFMMIHYYKNLAYFDSPWLEDDDITSATYLRALYTFDRVFIAVSLSLKSYKRTIMVINKINPPELYFLRTKCDLFQYQEDFQEAKQKDQDLLKSWSIDRPVLYISSKRPDSYKDNARFKKLMIEN